MEEEVSDKERRIVQLQQRLAVAEEGQAACQRRLEATERFKEEELRSVRETSKRIKEEEVKAARQLAAYTVDQLKVCVCLLVCVCVCLFACLFVCVFCLFVCLFCFLCVFVCVCIQVHVLIYKNIKTSQES